MSGRGLSPVAFSNSYQKLTRESFMGVSPGAPEHDHVRTTGLRVRGAGGEGATVSVPGQMCPFGQALPLLLAKKPLISGCFRLFFETSPDLRVQRREQFSAEHLFFFFFSFYFHLSPSDGT